MAGEMIQILLLLLLSQHSNQEDYNFCALATMVFDTSYSICNHIATGRYLYIIKNRFGGQESSVKR